MLFCRNFRIPLLTSRAGGRCPRGHRKNFIGLKGFDSSTLTPATLKIVPPSNVIAEWKKDYERMQESMIYGESLSFDKLIEQITELNRQINQM